MELINFNTYYSKDGKHRIKIGDCFDKVLSPDKNEYYNDCEIFIHNRYNCTFFPRNANVLKQSRTSLKRLYKYAIPIYMVEREGGVISLSDRKFNWPWYKGLIGFCCSNDESKARSLIKAWHSYINDPAYNAVLEECISLYTKDGKFYKQEWEAVDSVHECSSVKEVFDYFNNDKFKNLEFKLIEI